MPKRMGKFSRIVARALLLVFAFVVSAAQPAMGQSTTTEELPSTLLDALFPEPDPVPKSRYISLQPPRQGAPVALRVTLTDGRAPFNALSGLYKWVDAPTEIHDPSNPSGPVYVGRLTDRPVFVDWSTINVLHVGDRFIFPDTVYEVQAIVLGCSLYDLSCPASVSRTVDRSDKTQRGNVC